MKGSNMKKTILRGFFRGHPICLHAKFQVSYSTPSRFVKKMTYFCIIFAEKYFFAKYLQFYTSTKKFIKIRPKMSKRKPIKKKKLFFYLLTLLTYSALCQLQAQLLPLPGELLPSETFARSDRNLSHHPSSILSTLPRTICLIGSYSSSVLPLVWMLASSSHSLLASQSDAHRIAPQERPMMWHIFEK